MYIAIFNGIIDMQHDVVCTKTILSLLDARAKYFLFQTVDDDKDRKEPRLTRTFYGSFDQHCADLVKANELGAGVFVTVNKTKGSRRRKEDITEIRGIFQDDDIGFLGSYPLEPSRCSAPHVPL
jgi:hypothetical protein